MVGETGRLELADGRLLQSSISPLHLPLEALRSLLYHARGSITRGQGTRLSLCRAGYAVPRGWVKVFQKEPKRKVN